MSWDVQMGRMNALLDKELWAAIDVPPQAQKLVDFFEREAQEGRGEGPADSLANGNGSSDSKGGGGTGTPEAEGTGAGAGAGVGAEVASSPAMGQGKGEGEGGVRGPALGPRRRPRPCCAMGRVPRL